MSNNIKGHSMKKRIKIQLIGLVIGTILINACSQKETLDKPKENVIVNPTYVKTDRVINKKMAIPIHVIGKVASQMTSTLSFKTSGMIQTMQVHNGQKVGKRSATS